MATRKCTVSATREYAVSPTREYAVSPTREYKVSSTREYTVSPTREYTVSPTREYIVSSTREYIVSPTREYIVSPTREYPIAHAREFRHRAVSHGWTHLYRRHVGLPAGSLRKQPGQCPKKHQTKHVASVSLNSLSFRPLEGFIKVFGPLMKDHQILRKAGLIIAGCLREILFCKVTSS